MSVELITGATGFIGRYLTTALLNEGYTVWVVVRNTKTRSATAKVTDIFPGYGRKYPGHFKIVVGDLLHKNLGFSTETIRLLQKQNVRIWHLGANLSFRLKDRDSVYETNTTGTRHVVALANTLKAKLYFMSTAYVWGDYGGRCTEDELDKGQRHRNTYEKSKFDAEKIVRTACKTSSVIFRPSIVIGNTYEGKALGCTFGYYRYTFLFYQLKAWIVAVMKQKSSLWKRLFAQFGTRYSIRTDTLHIPWLPMPYPKNAPVDLIPIDYVIDSMIAVGERKDLHNRTFHLTNPDSPTYQFLVQSLAQDLRITSMRYFEVPNWMFRFLFRTAYYMIPPIRKYTRSVLWYIPYITHPNHFVRHMTSQFIKGTVPKIDRAYIKKINEYAYREVYRKIEIQEE